MKLDNLKKFFAQIKWYEYTYLFLFFATVITLGIVFKSSYLVILNSVFGIATCFFAAKGMLIANFTGIIQIFMYIAMCVFNKYYGEIIVCCTISIPVYVLSAITWFRNRNKENNVVKITKTVGWKEWVIVLSVVAVISVGLHFLLQVFNTANLLVSTISVGITALAGYLLMRRSEYNFIAFLANNTICFILWINIVLQGDISYITTCTNYVLYFSMNLFGIFNWLRLKKQQNNFQDNNLNSLEIKGE